MDPLSLLCRLATSVPPPRFHTVKYAGVLAPASAWRSRLAPQTQAAAASDEPSRLDHAGACRPWAELLARSFAVDVLACPTCQGRMKLLGLVKSPASIARYLATLGEAAEVPRRSPGRGPPYWKSRVLRRKVVGDEDEQRRAGPRGRRGGRVAARRQRGVDHGSAEPARGSRSALRIPPPGRGRTKVQGCGGGPKAAVGRLRPRDLTGGSSLFHLRSRGDLLPPVVLLFAASALASRHRAT
jgi:hypothetical protein